MTDKINVKATFAKENKFSCNSWQIDLDSVTPNLVSLNKGRGGCIRWWTESMNFTATSCQKRSSEELMVSRITHCTEVLKIKLLFECSKFMTKTSQVGHLEITWRLHKSQQKWSNLPPHYITKLV